MNIVNLRRGMGNVKGILPNGYRKVRGIRNISNAYIDTGVSVATIGKITSTIRYATLPTGNVGDGNRTGCYNFLGYLNSKNGFGGQWNTAGNTEKRINTGYDADYHSITIDVVNAKLYVDENQTNLSINATGVSANIYLFLRNGALTTIADSSRSEVIIYDRNLEKIRHFIPCVSSSNEVGMYDIVNNVFFTSPNGTQFIVDTYQ